MTIQCPRCPPNEDRRFISPKELVYHMDVEHPLDSLTGEIPGGSADPVDPGNKTVADLVERLEVAETTQGRNGKQTMSNRNRTAKGTTMVDKKLAKANERIAQMGQQLQATNLSLMNMRQMYEGAVSEKQGLRARLLQANQIITALVVQSRGKKLVIKEATFGKLQDFAGFEPVADDDGNLILTPITLEDMEEMEAALAEAEDEQA